MPARNAGKTWETLMNYFDFLDKLEELALESKSGADPMTRAASDVLTLLRERMIAGPEFFYGLIETVNEVCKKQQGVK